MVSLKNISFSLMLGLVGAIFVLLGLSGNGFTIGGVSLVTKELWARILLVLFGVIQGIFAAYLEIRAKPDRRRTYDEKAPSKDRDQNLSPYYDKFSEINEEDFLNKVDLSKVSRLFVLGHTGRNIYTTVHKRLEKLIPKGSEYFPEEIRILIRAPIVEGLRRNTYIHTTTVGIGNIRERHQNVDVRFYESVPSVRGIICQYRGTEKNRDCYITSYYWPEPNTSKAFDFAYVTKETADSPKPIIKVLESWINQYWGKDEIHTVVFDFDDTLVKTRDVQVKAWSQVIVDSLKDKIISAENLSNKFRKAMGHESLKSPTDPALLEAVKDVFIDKQMAEAIAQEIFINISDDTLRKINKRRFEIREELMDNSVLFDGVEKILEKLYMRYNLAIISSTDEQLISDFLKKKGLLKFFPVILGKRDPTLQFEREKIHHKTSLLIKLSEIIGMPLSRLVYIGDNNSDYLATRQLGLAFIEARQAAKLVGKESIITDIDPKKPPLPLGHFDSFENEQLLEILREHSEKLTKHKYQI